MEAAFDAAATKAGPKLHSAVEADALAKQKAVMAKVAANVILQRQEKTSVIGQGNQKRARATTDDDDDDQVDMACEPKRAPRGAAPLAKPSAKGPGSTSGAKGSKAPARAAKKA